ncbi:MAG: metallophosphoesterase family protein [Planctomycetaceae bacterium]|nr:metallophosphoesterase family protein [Planctomycetaceae bacterium]
MKTYKILLLTVLGLLLLAQTSARELPTDAVLAVKPTQQPDRVVLTWADDPATTQSITWRTSTEIGESFAELAKADSAPTFHESKQTFAAKKEFVESQLMQYHSHSITLTGLEPNTMYCYRVGQGDSWSEWFTFTTGGQSGEPFSFLYFGDAQNGLDSVYPRIVRKAFLTLPEAKFAIFAGDLVDVGSNERSWDHWFGALGFLAATYPIMSIPGNHEHEKFTDSEGNETRPLSNLWRPLFTLPENGPDDLKETCYTFVYNGVRFIGLDSTKGAYDFRGEGEIADWLEGVLKNNTSRWTVVYFHHPIYSSAKERNHVEWRAAIKPILDRYQVDLVLQGHDHVYTRTGMHTPGVEVVDLENVTERDVNSRTVYVTSVSGEKMYELRNKPFFEQALADVQLFQSIRIEGNTLALTSQTLTGTVVDAFVIEKSPSGSVLR